jgi:hypothetical protein
MYLTKITKTHQKEKDWKVELSYSSSEIFAA